MFGDVKYNREESQDISSACGKDIITKSEHEPNSFTYMRSEDDCVWHISFEQAPLRARRLLSSKAMHRVPLILQYLGSSPK
jgi:hypothetical protein